MNVISPHTTTTLGSEDIKQTNKIVKHMLLPFPEILSNINDYLPINWEKKTIEDGVVDSQRCISDSLNYALYRWSKDGWDILHGDVVDKTELVSHWNSKSELSEDPKLARDFYILLYPYLRALLINDCLILDVAQWKDTIGNDVLIEATFLRVH